MDGPKFGNVFGRWQHIPVLVPLQFSHKRAPMPETLIDVDEGSGQLRPYVRPVVRRSPRPSWVCAGVSGTDLDSVLKARIKEFTENTIARRFARRSSGMLKYNHTTRNWLAWGGTVWCPDELGNVVEQVRWLRRRGGTR